jgi:AAA15 family ATPase/GTPase
MNDFSMEKGKNVRKYKHNVLELGKQKLLKSAVLFGGNANGKTNLIAAINLLRIIVLQPTLNEKQKLPTDTFGYNEEDTKFDIEFIKMNRVFHYTLSYNADEIVYEILEIDNIPYMERRYQKFIILPDQLKPIKDNIRKNQNLLFFAQLNNVSEAKIAFSWFLENLVIVNTEQIPNSLFKTLQQDKFKKKFLKFLRAADFNITDVEVKERQESRSSIQLNFENGQPVLQSENESVYTTIYDIYSTHKSENGQFQVHFNNESTGTKVFMFLALYILQNENSEKVLLIDEFDRSFHIELAEALLDVFNNEKQTNQFILTTHELSLMDYNLRQDQIWFAEKNEFGETELFSIYDFDDDALKRSDFGYKRRYLEGRFGASQIVNKTVLLEVLEDSDGEN